MEAYGLEPQVALTVAYLDSWDGTGMSASRGNYIGLKEPPEEQFGKTMRIPDTLLEQWYTLVAERPVPEGDPFEAKLALARSIVERSHGKEATRRAEEHFTRVVREGKAPKDVPLFGLDPDEWPGDTIHMPRLLIRYSDAFGVKSKSEARRLIQQRAVEINGNVVTDFDVPRRSVEGALVQVGKRRFARFEDAV
jgi:tyrosyl-tRNA synthetase